MDKKTRHIIFKGPKLGLKERERKTIDNCISYLFSSFINHGNQRIIMIHTANIHKNIVKQLMYDRENNTNTKTTRW